MKSEHLDLEPASPMIFAAVCGAVIMLGLGVQMATNLALMGAAGLLIVSGQAAKKLSVRFMALTFLLMLALFFHHIVAIYQNISYLPVAIKSMVFGWLSYCVGYWLMSSANDDRGMRVGLLAASIAFGFVFVSIVAAINAGFPFQKMHVIAPINVLNDEPLHKTYIGISSSLGMCLAPLALLWRAQGTGQFLFKLLCVTLMISGFAANMALQNRTPVLALAGTLMIAVGLKAKEWLRQGPSLFSLAATFVGIPLILALTWLVIYLTGDLWGDVVFKQFQKGGLDTPRYLAWQAMLSGFFDHFWGGRRIYLTEAYAHNLWLDLLWDAGIPAFMLWVVFHVLHFRMLFVLIVKSETLLARYALLGLAVSYLLSFMVEPVNVASQYYVWASLLFFGGVSGMYAVSTKDVSQ